MPNECEWMSLNNTIPHVARQFVCMSVCMWVYVWLYECMCFVLNSFCEKSNKFLRAFLHECVFTYPCAARLTANKSKNQNRRSKKNCYSYFKHKIDGILCVIYARDIFKMPNIRERCLTSWDTHSKYRTSAERGSALWAPTTLHMPFLWASVSEHEIYGHIRADSDIFCFYSNDIELVQ